MEILENQQISKEFTINNNNNSSKESNMVQSSPIPIKKSTSYQNLLNMSLAPSPSSGASTPTISTSPSLNQESSSVSSSTSTNSGSSGSWTPDISNILSSLTKWLKGIEYNKVSEEEYKLREMELWNDWEWILSTTEEFLIKQNQTENARVLDELDILKKAASNLKVKPIFINRATKILNSQFSKKDIEVLSNCSLDPNKRLGIITTAINTVEVEWLNYIKQTFFTDEIENDENNDDNNNSNDEEEDNNGESSKNTQFELAEDGWEDNNNNNNNNNNNSNNLNNNNSNINLEETKELRKLDNSGTTFDMVVLKKNINKITWEQYMDNFKGSKYSKGVHGRMKDLGWQASHGVDGSLNSRVIGDITWSIWNTLTSSIKQIRDITPEETNGLIDIVCYLQPMLVRMWLDTKKNSRIGTMNEGIVVEKWKQEENKKKKKIIEMKKSGLLDKYNPEKIKILDHERKEISQIRSNLEKKLKLKKIDKI